MSQYYKSLLNNLFSVFGLLLKTIVNLKKKMDKKGSFVISCIRMLVMLTFEVPNNLANRECPTFHEGIRMLKNIILIWSKSLAVIGY